MKLRKALALVVAVLVFSAVMAPAAWAVPAVGEHAYSYVQQLEVQSRVAGTQSERDAATKMKGWFEAAGYSAWFQPFTYVGGKSTYPSQNVVAFKRATKRTGKVPLVIVGAHYDSVIAGTGADDNASGAAVMLEVAEMVARYQRDYDVAFVAFGAEEAGLEGSAFYASQMPKADKDRTIAMINFDSLIAGDKLYIHSGFNRKTAPRDAMLTIIDDLNLPIEMQPGLNEHYPAGFTPDGFSDYTAFNQAGIPVVAFESTNWEIGDLDGYMQTEKYGSFWHTGKDTLATIEQRYPGRPMERLSAYTMLVSQYLADPTP
jgi:hypothetical protein